MKAISIGVLYRNKTSIIMNSSTQTNVRFKDSIAEFNQIRTNALSGNLVIQVADTPSWMLCFTAGRLAGVSGGIDAINRWERNLALASLNVPLDRLVKSSNHQEIFLNSNKIAQEYAIQEVLFDIIQFSQNQGDRLIYRFIPIKDKHSQVQSVLPLLELQPILTTTIQIWQEWQQRGLASYPPSFFPIIKQTDLSNYQDLHHLIESIDGSKSLRNIAIAHQRKLIDVATDLLPLFKSNAIYLSKSKQSIIDRDLDSKVVSAFDLVGGASPVENRVKISLPNSIISERKNNKLSHLIACVDDSLAVYKNLEKIITDYGYRSFGVQDPLKIIPSLIRNKPDLIFLDLVMPVTNGYEVCEQIRKTPSLANIPIIILTGSDGLIDRVRTKFVGASGFLGKPIQSEQILKTIDKYLGIKQSNKTADYIYKDPAIGAKTPSNPIGIANQAARQILVVDDDRNIREVVSMCLNKLKSWEVLTAASGQEGLDQIQTNSPDAIVLDVMMPEMDGLAFLRQLRSHHGIKKIPVILLTANRYLPDKDLLTELGVVEVISKPFLPIDLVRQIDRALLN
jgi:two-component system, chemotaxis family, response regulator PixG